MRSFIQPIFKIVTAACLFSRPCSACTRFYKSSLLTADIKGQSFKRLRPNFCRTSKSKSSNAPITLKGLSFCRDAGLSSAPSRGSIAVAAWPRISKISPETHSLFSASPRFVSCSESFVRVNKLFGPTLSLRGPLRLVLLLDRRRFRGSLATRGRYREERDNTDQA